MIENPWARKEGVYVAAPFSEHVQARALMDLLELRGYQITFDWTRLARDTNEVEDVLRTERMMHAEQDLFGVDRALIVILLTHEDKAKGCGMYFEAGFAIAKNKRLITVGPARDRSIFMYLGEQYETIAQMLEAL